MNNDRFLTRVWDKREKKMLIAGKDYESIDAKGLWLRDYEPTFIPFGDRFVPMQCTGLRDKDGKLIYEGDILRENDDIEYMMIKLNDLNELTGDWNYYTSQGELWKEMEVIGNRWENPELLEVKE